jgi:ADP-ribosylglycohydrolase
MANPERIRAALRSLDGLSVGDAFGECFFSIQLNPLSLQMHLESRTLPNHRWRWTDDTAMAISIVELLLRNGKIDQDELARSFANRYMTEDFRGYGGTAHGILRAIHAGSDWLEIAPKALGGMGSMGNGGAMRVAPLGAFFAGDTAAIVEQATRSAEVTHAHRDGQAGAVAVALAAGFVAASAESATPFDRDRFFDYILQHTPDSQTRALTLQARDLPGDYAIETAVSVLGNGSQITSPDTVPFCLWCAAKSAGDFETAMWTAVAGGGDMDTTCAIAGGIVASARGGSPPDNWVRLREPLPAGLIPGS